MLIRDFSQDPYGNRVALLLYGRQKVGKTTALLKLVEDGEFLVLLSADRGTMKARLNPGKYKNRLAIAYPSSLREIRNDLREMNDTVKKICSKVDPSKVWAAIDTMTHLQTMLLSEARKLDVNMPSIRKNERKTPEKGKDVDDSYLRDMTTRVDFLVNLGHMAEVMDGILSFPCNIVLVALEKNERDKKDRPVHYPAISGQSYTRITGDVDAVLHMELDGDTRVLHCQHSSDYEAGDRSGNLAETEPIDLSLIRRKMLGIPIEQK